MDAIFATIAALVLCGELLLDRPKHFSDTVIVISLVAVVALFSAFAYFLTNSSGI